MANHTDGKEWHDLYRGRGAEAQYMGSVRSPYNPLELLAYSRFLAEDTTSGPVTTDSLGVRWERTVQSILKGHHTAAREWPHEHTTSALTPWSWHMEGTVLFVYRYGTPYLSLSPLAKRASTTAFPVVTR